MLRPFRGRSGGGAMGRNLLGFELSAEQCARFVSDGFLAIDTPIVPQAEIDRIRTTLDRLFAARAGWDEGAQFDLVGSSDDRGAQQSLPQLLEPVSYASELRRLQYREIAASIARQLLGRDARPSFEHALLKPAHHGAATPWHQDEAYRVDPGFEYRQLSIWMPLQYATVENGCMQYIPNSHRNGNVLTHRAANGNRSVHAVECVGDFDPSQAVACPLPPGGIVIHHGLTLHYAGPNTTDQPRYAYVLGFELPPAKSRNSLQRVFPWNAERESANRQRRRAWLRRGGFAVFLMRKLRYGGLSLRELRLQVQRTLRYLRGV